jgi:hypothetical protein
MESEEFSISGSLIVILAGSLEMDGCEIKDISSDGNGSAINGIINNMYILTVKNSLFNNCRSIGDENYGGAIYCILSNSGIVNVEDTTFANCVCDGSKGEAIYLLINEECDENYDLDRIIFSYIATTSNSIVFIDYPSLFESANISTFTNKFEGWGSNGYDLNLSSVIGQNRKIDVSHSYPIIYFLNEYNANTIYIRKSSILLPSYDGIWCGRAELPCSSISYGKTRLSSATRETITNELKIIESVDIVFTGVNTLYLEDVTLISNEAHSCITIYAPSSMNPSMPVITYKSVVRIENIEFKLETDSTKKFNSLIGNEKHI